MTVDVSAGVAQDAAGNNNTAATQFSIVFDGSAPSVVISSALSSPTNTSPIPVTITFSESVTGFSIGDLTVGNGSASGFAGSGTTYTANITPSGDGAVTVDVSAGVAQDAAGNSNNAATQFSIVFDGTAPTVSISSALSSPTSTSPIPVTITFSESVTGFVVGDITVGNGSVSNFAGSGSSYTVDVTPVSDGAVTVDVGAGVAQDAAGNSNNAATQFSIVFDGVVPSVTLSTTSSSPTNVSPIPVTITFSESVNGFTSSDVVVTNGTKSNFAGSGAAYTIDVTPTVNGTVTINVGAGVAQDSSGNNNTAATPLSVVYDNTSPSVTISSTLSSPTNASPIPVTITFSESVTGFTSGDLTVGNGTISGFAGSGTTYTFNVTPSSEGGVTIDVGAGVAQDAAGNTNNAASQLVVAYDTTSPTTLITSNATSPTNTSPILITVIFSEPVTGFANGDIVVTNGTKSGFAGSGTTYTVNVTPAGDGTITANVAGGVAQDAAGNGNAAATQFSIVYDSAAPTVAITSSASSPTNTSPIPITITFSEPVTGFAVGDLVVGNGTASGFAGSGATYTANITPSSDGAVTVDVGAGAAQDAAGTDNTAATQFSIVYDSTAPTVAITSTLSSPTNTSPIPVTITFSESVTGFVVGDIVVSNGTKSNFAGSGSTYTVDVTPSSSGTVTVNVAGGVAQDAAGNNNTAASQFSIDYNNDAPTVVITSTASPATNVSPIPITITFSEPVILFTIFDLSVSGGFVSSFGGSGAVYTAEITPTGQGTITVDIADNAAQDLAANGNTAAAQFSIVYDTTAPTVSITSSASPATSTSPIPVTITFSESVTGFVVGDVTVGNGTASGFAGSGTTYTLNVTPTAEGAVTVNVAGSVAQDAAGNNNAAASQLSVIYDVSVPSVIISSGLSSPTNTSPIPVTITFSESVTGFVLGDVNVGNGSASGFAGSGTTYTLNVTPSASGTVTVDVAGGVAQDAAGNTNTAALPFSITYDGTSPTVVISSSESSPTNTSPIPVTITFSESVTGFVVGDVVVSNGTKSNFAGSGTTYTLDVTPTSDGVVTVNVAGGVAQDAVGNDNTAALPFSITYDGTSPTVVISSSESSPTKNSPIPVTITFSESVTGFVVGDIDVSNGTKSNFAGSGTTYTVDVTPTANGTVTVDIDASVAQDASGNTNTAAAQFSIAYDTTAPTVSITSSESSPTNNIPFEVTITFSESVTGFVVGDLLVGNGSASGFAGSGTTYTVDVTPAADGTVTVDVAGGVAQDAAGNNNTAASQFSIVFDGSAPSVSITSSESSPTNNSPIPVTITFSESVTGFTVGDLGVGNGTVSGFAGSGTTYTVDVTPSADGTVTVNVAGGVAQDAAGNNNTAALPFSITYDGSAPSVSITSSESSPTSTSPIPVTITFSESVTGFVVGDVVVTNGTKSNFAGSGTTYTVDVTPAADGSVLVNIAGGVAQDAAGNNNTAATPFSIVYDTVSPNVSITSSESSPTNNSPIPVTITFSESVTGFVVGDITVGNGSLSNFAGSGTTYTVDVTPSADGSVTVDVAGGVAQDAAGNTNAAALPFSITYDGSAPSVSITSSESSPTNNSPIPVTITFSESVTGFVVGDITVGNGSLSNFAGSGTTYTVDVTPTANGSVLVDVAGGVAQDSAGNGNTAATSFSIVYDTVSPNVSITSSESSPTNNSPIPVTITFSESVTGFVVGDIAVGNGSASNFAGSGTTYTVDVTPTVSGTVTVDVAGGVAQDAAGNTNTAASQFSISYDGSAPSVSISSALSSPTNTSPIPVTITFSENVTGFVLGDITVGNGTASGFAGSGTTYTANITPLANGVVTVDVGAGVAQDAANNDNTAASQFTITYDGSAPSVVIASTLSSPTSTSPIPVTITFSESVTGFAIGDLVVSNGTASSFTGSGASYAVNITPLANGVVTVDVAGGVAQDAAGNNNTSATQFAITYDSSNPSVVISSSAGTATNSSPIPITVTFSESVTGFTFLDVDISGGLLTGFSGSGATYSFNIIPFGQGPITVDIDAGVAQDGSGNPNTAAAQFTIVYDTTSPTVTITSSATNPTNTSPIPVTITFSESVTGFVIGDITVGNGSLSNFAGSGTTYTVDVTPSTNGAVTVNVAGGVAQDAAGNNNTAATQLSRTYDNSSPSVSISSSSTSPTNNNPIPVTITFSESVTGFVVGDITVGNGSASNFAGSGTTYTANITPTSNGPVTVDVAGGVAQDSASNGNTAAAQFSIAYDGTAPSVSITSGLSSPTNTSPIPVTITFSESVTGFVVGDITVGNGSASNFAGSGTTYTVDVTPSADGAVTVDVAGGVAQDAAGNNNTAASQFSITYDGSAPSVSITSSESSPTNNSPIPVTITFSESVTGFTVGDLSVGNGTVSGFAGSGTTYTVDVTPSADGAVTVDVAGGVAQDAAGNNNTAASQFSIVFDGSAPSVSITSSESSPTNTSPIPVTITFSESVTGFTIGDITVGNGSASNFAGSGTTYTVDITPAADGTVTVNVAGGVAQDAAGNNNTAASQFSITYDGSAPSVSITSSESSPTNTSPIPVTITFSESVTGFVVGDITVGNGSASNFAGSGTTYTVDVTPSSDGSVTVDVAGGVAQDAAGNNNTAASQFSITYDGSAPSVSITSSESSPTNTSPISVTITFSESVTGFVVGDIIVGNGSLSNFAGSGTTYTVDVTPAADGNVTVDVAGGVAQDAAGNGNTAAAQFSIAFDTSGPTVSITSSESSPTNASPIPVTITFSESVTGFVVGDIIVGNGSASNFTGSGTTYTIDVTPSSDGSVTVDVAGGVAQDAAGNNNTAASQFLITYDGSAPSVSITSSESSPTNNSPIPVTITFSESVTGFVIGDISVGNGSLSNFAGSGSTYTVDVIPSANGSVTVDVAGGVAQDAAGNGNTAAAQFSITYDGSAPSVSITSSESSPTSSSPIPVTITFSESVTGFVIGDILVSNGSLSNFAGSGTTYTVDVTPTADGTVLVDVAGGVAQDAAGNNNTAATQFTIVFDGTAPSVNITSSESSPTNNSPIPVTITFSESVTGFVMGDITVGNGSLSNFAGSGTTYTVDVTPTADGTVLVDVAGGVAQDAAGNNNTAASQFSITYDGSSPSVSISSISTDPTNVSPIPVTITFSESVTGFVVGDITVGNGSLSNFAGSGTTYTVDVTPSANGTVTVDVAGGVAQDVAGNNNTAASQFSIVYDNFAPSVSIASSETSPTNTSPIPVTITFSESVTGFVVGDLVIGNGSASNFAGSGTTYTVDVTPSANGTVTVDVVGGVAQDAAGNNNTAATQFSIVYDNSAPSVSITSSESSPTNTSPIPVTITFSESVTGFVVGDIAVGNGSASNFAGGGTTYAVDVTRQVQMAQSQ
ncbi:MAG: Ig-like domain-containing protein [Bdellovibrionota bacterium]